MRNVNTEILHSLFEYRDNLLYNKITRSPTAVKGRVSGSFNKTSGYMRVCVYGVTYGLSRIVWMFHNGDIPDGMQIDHIDRNPLNNAIENLRCVTPQVNEWNKAHKNVNFEKGKWRARVQKDGKHYNYGLYNFKDDAIKAAQEGKSQLRSAI
jgi:hypothetical protein